MENVTWLPCDFQANKLNGQRICFRVDEEYKFKHITKTGNSELGEKMNFIQLLIFYIKNVIFQKNSSSYVNTAIINQADLMWL